MCRPTDLTAMFPALSNRMHAAAVAAAAHAPCDATVVIDMTSCGGPRVKHAACIIVAAGVRLAGDTGDGQPHRRLWQAGELGSAVRR